MRTKPVKIISTKQKVMIPIYINGVNNINALSNVQFDNTSLETLSNSIVLYMCSSRGVTTIAYWVKWIAVMHLSAINNLNVCSGWPLTWEVIRLVVNVVVMWPDNRSCYPRTGASLPLLLSRDRLYFSRQHARRAIRQTRANFRSRTTNATILRELLTIEN